MEKIKEKPGRKPGGKKGHKKAKSIKSKGNKKREKTLMRNRTTTRKESRVWIQQYLKCNNIRINNIKNHKKINNDSKYNLGPVGLRSIYIYIY